jgi:hypothetical protein
MPGTLTRVNELSRQWNRQSSPSAMRRSREEKVDSPE